MHINIELKCPGSAELKQRYNYELACEIVLEHINRHGVQKRTIVSSFEQLVTTHMTKIAFEREFSIIQLLNYDEEEKDGYQTPNEMEGINVDLKYLR